MRRSAAGSPAWCRPARSAGRPGPPWAGLLHGARDRLLPVLASASWLERRSALVAAGFNRAEQELLTRGSRPRQRPGRSPRGGRRRARHRRSPAPCGVPRPAHAPVRPSVGAAPPYPRAAPATTPAPRSAHASRWSTKEESSVEHYCTRAEARAAIFAWIAWCNRSRLRSTTATCQPSSGNTSTPPAIRYHRP